jgi:hypothetical protein
MNNKAVFLPKLTISIPDKEKKDSPILYKKQSIYNELPKKNNINHSIFELALITLNITLEDYKNMNVNELPFIDVSENKSKKLAVEILVHYKNCNFSYC